MSKSEKSLTGTRVCMTIWNSLRHDARVVRSAEELVKAGAEVTVIASNWDDSLPVRETHPLGFDVIRVRRPTPLKMPEGDSGIMRPGRLSVFWRYLRGLTGHVRMVFEAWKLNSDVYHAHDIVPLPTTWVVAKLRRRPLIYDAHEISTDREAFQRISGLVRKVEGYAVRRIEGMITTTDMRADHFVAEYGVARPVVIQNRPPYREVKPTQRLREHLRIPDESPIILYQGGLQQGRGLPELLKVSVRVPKAHFVLMGPGSIREKLVAQAVDLGVRDRVHFPPAVPWEELHHWTSSADIGVQLLQNTCLNHYTTDSNKLFEYAIAGLPVVASDFPEIRRVIEEHPFGMLVDPANEDAVVKTLNQLVNDESLRNKLSVSALDAAPELSWETQAPKLLGLYRLVMSNEQCSK